MTAIDIYRAQYAEESTRYYDRYNKYHWAARKIFNLTTYDEGLDELFVKDILEVCKVILEMRNHEYIKDEKNYIKYILVCQLLERFRWINWGTSIRGAWFEVDIQQPWPEPEPKSYSKDILEELEWCEYDFEKKRSTPHKIEKVPFTVDNLKALIKFVEEDEEEPISDDILDNLKNWKKELEE